MDTPLEVVILAAGLGTRLKSRKAKVLHRAGGRTLIEHVVRAALEVAPPGSIHVVVGHQAGEVQAAVEGLGVRFVLQPEQRGTGHAVRMARESLEGAGGLVLVLYGDTPLLRGETLRRLVERQRQGDAAVTIITTLLADPTGYGRILHDDRGGVRAIVEQKAASAEQVAIQEINSGIYCFRSELLWKSLDALTPNPASGEYYLTDVIEPLHAAGHALAALRLEDSRELLGINTRIDLAAVDRMFRERKLESLMLEGVTIVKPETVTVDMQARVGMDTVIEPFVQILGSTEIGEDCRIGSAAIIQDSTLAASVTVEAFSMIRTSRVDSGARIGPFARLRPDSHVETGAHVGNFVELKKTRLGPGAKAQHLAYLGDSDIGAGVNIGAGTITCNYDGEKKHRTQIGEGAFIGSNSTLVAPVEVGEGSYVGAASVITDPVPAGALALGRGRQVVKEGWVRRRRERSGELTAPAPDDKRSADVLRRSPPDPPAG